MADQQSAGSEASESQISYHETSDHRWSDYIWMDRTDTPETLLTEYTNRPDITILCEKCGFYLDVRTLQEHRAFHTALLRLHYRGNQFPESTDALLHRRNLILRRLKAAATEDNPIRPKQIQLVNDAFELVKSYVEDTFEEYRQVRNTVDANVNGYALNCSPGCCYAVGFCASQNERWKNGMEDTRVYQDYYGDDKDKCFLGLYDGYHGRFAAELAASELHHVLLKEMAKFDPKTKSTMAFNMADEDVDLEEYDFHRPETKDSMRVAMHQESMSMIQQIMDKCEDKYQTMIDKDPDPEEDEAGEKKDKKKKKKKKISHPMVDKFAKAFYKAYHMTDILMSYGKDERSKIRWSGCSAATVVVQNLDKEGIMGDAALPSNESEEISMMTRRSSMAETPRTLGLLHLANSGNVHALLVRGNRPYRLTKDHTPRNARERQRVEKAGANLSDSRRDPRVNGVLATTRGLGNHGDVPLKKCVLVDPYTTSVPIDQYAQILVLASHGLWEVFSDQEVASLLLRLLPSNYVPPPSKMSLSLQPLMDSLEGGNANSPHRSQEGQTSRRVSFSSVEILPNIHSTPTSAEALSRKLMGLKAASAVEEEKETGPGMLTIEADKKTEAGSHLAEEEWQEGTVMGSEGEHITIPEHSSYKPRTPETREERQREVARSMAEYLVQAALLGGARDNITVEVLLLSGCGL